MKKIIFSIFIALSCSVSAQVGINNESPKASLHIKGSTGTDILRVDSAGVAANTRLIIKDSGNVGIQTNVPTQDLHINKGIRVSSMQSKIADTANYKYVHMTNSDGVVGRVKLKDYFMTELPNVRSMKYVSKTTTLDVPNFHPDSTITKLGVLSIRYDPNDGNGFLQFRVDSANYYTMYYKKFGTGIQNPEGGNALELRYYQNNSRNPLNGGVWEKFPDDFNAMNRDLGSAIILLNNTGHVYRVTLNANGTTFHNSNPDNVSRPVPQITIFLEQTLNEL